jgi:hypothetical protein
VELQQQPEGFRKQGMAVASLSYDSAALLADFAARKGISYPMLSDPDSKVIRAFGILNTNLEPGTPFYGVPFPGLYVIDEHGTVKAKYFEDDHRERYTAGDVLTRGFGADGTNQTTIETPHLKLTSSASDAATMPGGRVALILDLELKPGMHVYAPGVQGGYIAIDWRIPESKAWLAEPAGYPTSRILNLPVIHETVPVYEGRFRLVRDLTIGQQNALAQVLAPDRTLKVEGTFRYQACDDKECYPPRTIPLQWSIRIEPLDSQRAPAALQRKPQ